MSPSRRTPRCLLPALAAGLLGCALPAAASAAGLPHPTGITGQAGAKAGTPLTLRITARAPKYRATVQAGAKVTLIGGPTGSGLQDDLGLVKIPALRPGQQYARTVQRTSRATLPAGDYQLRVCVGSGRTPMCVKGTVLSLRAAGATSTTPTVLPAALTASSASVSFGNGVVASSAGVSRTVSLTNTGSAATGTLLRTVTGSAATDFTVTAAGDAPCGGVLYAGTRCTLVVTFRPSVRGARAATLLVAATPGGERAISLTGTGLSAATLSSDAGPSNVRGFGTLPVSRPAGLAAEDFQQTITITNTGEVASQTLSLVPQSGFGNHFTVLGASTCAGAALAPGASCTLTIEASAADGTNAAFSSAVVVTDGTASTSVGTSATFVASARLAFVGAPGDGTLHFGDQIDGDPAGTQTITVKNTGGESVETLNVALDGPNAGRFVVDESASTCPLPVSLPLVKNAALAGGGATTCTVVIRHQAPAGQSTDEPVSATGHLASPEVPAGTELSVGVDATDRPAAGI